LKIGYARKTYDWCELLSNKLCNMHGIDWGASAKYG
jgi:hypothetical protein